MGLRLKTGITSDTIPKLGRTMMYTSGWPKIQNRCSHRNGSPPLDASKKWQPNSRSNISRNSATVMTGRANTSRNCTMKVIQVNTGIFIRVMPGARMLSTVTVRLIAETVEAMPMISRPTA